MVLLVDDDTDFLDVACAIFADASLRVCAATTGADALRLLERHAGSSESERLDCVVLDMRLPDMTAAEVLERAGTRLANVPVLVLTQALWRVDATRVREAGAGRIREKPGKLSALRTLLIDFAAESMRGSRPPTT